MFSLTRKTRSTVNGRTMSVYRPNEVVSLRTQTRIPPRRHEKKAVRRDSLRSALTLNSPKLYKIDFSILITTCFWFSLPRYHAPRANATLLRLVADYEKKITCQSATSPQFESLFNRCNAKGVPKGTPFALAEVEGFEPPWALTQTVFKTASL